MPQAPATNVKLPLTVFGIAILSYAALKTIGAYKSSIFEHQFLFDHGAIIFRTLAWSQIGAYALGVATFFFIGIRLRPCPRTTLDRVLGCHFLILAFAMMANAGSIGAATGLPAFVVAAVLYNVAFVLLAFGTGLAFLFSWRAVTAIAVAFILITVSLEVITLTTRPTPEEHLAQFMNEMNGGGNQRFEQTGPTEGTLHYTRSEQEGEQALPIDFRDPLNTRLHRYIQWAFYATLVAYLVRWRTRNNNHTPQSTAVQPMASP